ncbi:MAG TPA: cellulase family glycosylhydrolase, partial [Microthrixaceae bacterium]|nr:cellulase family glycosylhydrolase [Microthrixaceae bacterium]
VDIPIPEEPVIQSSAPDSVGPLRMRGADLIDAEGRVVLIHGMNSVKKDAPFISPLTSGWLGQLEREYLANSGFNAIRLGVDYAALMPEPGVIDEAYIDQVVLVVDQMSEDGFWVQLDFHQDVFHQMPTWATPPNAANLSDEAPEILSFIGWAARYMSDKSMRQWNSFVKGEPIIDGRSVASVLGDAAAALAERVIDHKNVIGIELLNEPFPGTPIIDCILQGCPGRDRLLSERYAEMIAPIRSVAPEMPIWIEPFAPTGYAAFPAMPAPQLVPASDGAQLGLAWHLYCKDTDGGSSVPSDAGITNFCEQRMANGFKAGANLARRLGVGTGSNVGVPRMLNEFGASNDPLDVTIATRMADEQFVSWMYWHGSTALTPIDSSIPDVVEAQIIRPYPQATAGTPGSLKYVPSSGDFSYKFVPDATITAPTSIAVPARAYPAGYQASVANGTITSSEQAGRLTVVPDGSGLPVTVTISRLR